MVSLPALVAVLQEAACLLEKKSHVITWIPPTQRGRFSLWSSLKGSKPTYERFRANQRGLSCTWISFDNILMASASSLTELWILLSLQSNSSLTKGSFQQFSKYNCSEITTFVLWFSPLYHGPFSVVLLHLCWALASIAFKMAAKAVIVQNRSAK